MSIQAIQAAFRVYKEADLNVSASEAAQDRLLKMACKIEDADPDINIVFSHTDGNISGMRIVHKQDQS